MKTKEIKKELDKLNEARASQKQPNEFNNIDDFLQHAKETAIKKGAILKRVEALCK